MSTLGIAATQLTHTCSLTLLSFFLSFFLFCPLGIVFDARHSAYSNSWKQHNGGKCLTMFTAGRVATDGISLPASLADFTQEHHRYVNATLVDWARSYQIVGHMADREKYTF